jgi:hypothetical protein
VHTFYHPRRLAIAVLLFLTSAIPSFADGVTLLPQEQAIADYMASNPQQGRPTLILDPIIEAVARARAADMAHRNYFSHVNPDGVAANYLLRKAGYVLPSWWGTDPTANYVESIAAGYSDPGTAWTAWMNSPDHKEHLLALNSFFATETHYGVGYYYDSSSTYQYYWVVITAPPQPPLPIAITTPAADSRITTPTLSVAGTVDTTTAAATLQLSVANSTGTTPFTPVSGLATWSGTIGGLAPGSNTITAQSLDSSGNVVATATRTITYIEEGSLTISHSGSGSVTSAYAGTTIHPVGATITVKATPASGSVFAGWSGSIVSGSPTLSFAMQNGLSLQANFIPNPFGPVAAAHYGLLTSGSAEQDGLVRITLSSNGVFTGRVQFPGAGYGFIGRLNADGTATVTIPRHGLTPLTVTVQADLTGGTGDITGTVSDGTSSFSFTDSSSSFNARTAPAPQAGRYTLVLTPDSTSGTSAPQGNGYAAVVVHTNGDATVAGRLADGTPYSAAGHVTKDGSLAIYTVPSASPRGSSLNGLVTFRGTDVSDLDGAFTWRKGSNTRDAYYPHGFSTQLPSVGSLYTRPVSGIKPLALTSGTATAGLGEGNLAQPINVPMDVTSTDKATMLIPGSPDLQFKINPLSGTVSGSFLLPDGTVTHSLRGVVFQKQKSAFGYFLGTDQAGYFSLSQGS